MLPSRPPPTKNCPPKPNTTGRPGLESVCYASDACAGLDEGLLTEAAPTGGTTYGLGLPKFPHRGGTGTALDAPAGGAVLYRCHGWYCAWLYPLNPLVLAKGGCIAAAAPPVGGCWCYTSGPAAMAPSGAEVAPPSLGSLNNLSIVPEYLSELIYTSLT